MKRTFCFTCFVIMLALLLVSCSKTGGKTPRFDHYGVYIKQQNGFTEIKGYKWSGIDDIYKNSSEFDKTPINYDDALEIYVYNAQAKTLEYGLIRPDEQNRNGDFVCANFGFGRKCPEEEFTVQPVEDKEDIVIINSKPQSGVLILHVQGESKGYVFQVVKQ